MNLSASFLGKYIRFESTPAALTGTSPGIKYESSVYGPVVTVESFTFQTDFDPATDGTFTPSVTYTGSGTPKWVFEDGSSESGAAISVTTGNGLDGTTQDVVLKVQTLDDVTGFSAADDELAGTFDSSTLEGLTILSIYSNNLTGLVFHADQDFTTLDIAGNTSLSIAGSHFAVPSFSSTSFEADDITITGTFVVKSGSSFKKLKLHGVNSMVGVDVSNATFTGGASDEIDISEVSTCTTLTLPASSGGTIGGVRATESGLTSLDVSGMEILKTLLYRLSTSLTSVTYGNQTNAWTHILANGCTLLTGTQDLSGFTNVPNYMIFDDSPITELSLPTSTNTITSGIYINNCDLSTIDNLANCSNLLSADGVIVDLRDNNMTSSEVNEILDDLDTIVGGGYSARYVKIEGTNSDPTSGPPDGDAAVTSLTDDGVTVTTS